MPFYLLLSYFIGLIFLQYDFQKMFGIFIWGSLSFFIIFTLERFFPFKEKWNNLGKEEIKDIFHISVGTNLGSFLGNSINLFLIEITFLLFNLGQSKGLNLWPESLSFELQIMLVMVIADFGRYWQHRFHHMNSKMWNFHELHHDDNKLNTIKTRDLILSNVSLNKQQCFFHYSY